MQNAFFSDSSLLAIYCNTKYNANWPTYDLKPYSCALLSDNLVLVDLIFSISLKGHSGQILSSHDLPYWYSILKGIYFDDLDIIKIGLNKIYDQISKKKEVSIAKAHLLCAEGITERNETKLLEGINIFELKRNKSRLIKVNLEEIHLSFHPLSYAKLAWMKGMRFEIDNPSIPMNLLSIDNNIKYDNPYWFLRDFLSQTTLDLPYKPIFPDVQSATGTAI